MEGEEELENLGPSIHLPDEQEFLEIVRKAVMESRLYEPFTLLEKRVLHSICIEKKPTVEDFESINN